MMDYKWVLLHEHRIAFDPPSFFSFMPILMDRPCSTDSLSNSFLFLQVDYLSFFVHCHFDVQTDQNAMTIKTKIHQSGFSFLRARVKLQTNCVLYSWFCAKAARKSILDVSVLSLVLDREEEAGR